jgi:hypothetical protein
MPTQYQIQFQNVKLIRIVAHLLVEHLRAITQNKKSNSILIQLMCNNSVDPQFIILFTVLGAPYVGAKQQQPMSEHHMDGGETTSGSSMDVQTVGSVQTEIIICIRNFFGLSNYEPN